MKQFINDPAAVVDEMLDGFVAAHDGRVHRPDDTNLIVRSDAPVEGKVSIVTGGGSGHETMHAGYVGPGMLDSAAAGAIFTSPPAAEFADLINEVDDSSGVLAVIKNYEGDIMNFETAIDLAGDANVETVTVNDDVAVIANGLGTTPLSELYVVNRMLNEILSDADIDIYRSLVGEYCTSLDMSGCSITLLELDKELKELLDHPAATPALTIRE